MLDIWLYCLHNNERNW